MGLKIQALIISPMILQILRVIILHRIVQMTVAKHHQIIQMILQVREISHLMVMATMAMMAMMMTAMMTMTMMTMMVIRASPSNRVIILIKEIPLNRTTLQVRTLLSRGKKILILLMVSRVRIRNRVHNKIHRIRQMMILTRIRHSSKIRKKKLMMKTLFFMTFLPRNIFK